MGNYQPVETFVQTAHSHWAIENGLHWALDVTFQEDGYWVRQEHAPQNFFCPTKVRPRPTAPLNEASARDAKQAIASQTIDPVR